MRWLDGITDSINGHEPEQTLGDSEGQRSLMVLQFMGSQRVRHDLVAEQQQSSSPVVMCECKLDHKEG